MVGPLEEKSIYVGVVSETSFALLDTGFILLFVAYFDFLENDPYCQEQEGHI